MALTRTQRFLGGVATGYANQALVTLVNLWLTAFLLRALGNRDYGLWLVATQMLGYLLLADVGVVALLPREVAYATGRVGGSHETPELRSLLRETAGLMVWQTPVVAAAAAIIWLALPAGWQPLRAPLVLVLMVFVLAFPLRLLQAALHGLQDLGFLGLAQLGAWFVSTAATVFLAVAGLGLYALAGGWILSQLLNTGACFWRLKKNYPGVLPEWLPRVGWARARAYLSRSAWVSIAQVAQVFVNGSDVLIIGKILGPVATVPYFCTDKLVTVLGNQPQMLMQSAGPALAELRTAETRARLLQATTALTQAMLMLSGAVGCVVLAVNEGFVRWWVGGTSFGGLFLTISLTALMILRHWNTTAVYTIFALGYERLLSLTALCDGVLTMAASIALVPRFGLVGAPVASLAGVLLVSLPSNLTALARETGQTIWGIASTQGGWLWRFVLAAALAWAIAPLARSGTFFRLVAVTLAVGTVYAALMVPLALRDPLGLYVRPRVHAIRARLFKRAIRNADA